MRRHGRLVAAALCVGAAHAVARPGAVVGAAAGPRGAAFAADGWWAASERADGSHQPAPQTALARMNALLRRQLNEGDEALAVYSYDTDAPSAMPTPLPTPVPTSNSSECPSGTFKYELALFDYGGDGWGEDGKYILSEFIGDSLEFREKIAEGTVVDGSEVIDSFCLENGNYVVDFGGGPDPGEMGIQWLPDDVQKITTCRGPCQDLSMMVDGLVMEVTIQPSVSPAPTGVSARVDTHHLMSVDVTGIPQGSFPPDAITALVIQGAVSDSITIVEDPEQVLDPTATFVPPDARRRLQADPVPANDDVHQIDMTINMGAPHKTCGQSGFSTADQCLNGEGFTPKSLVAGLNEAIESGYFTDRLLFYLQFYGRPVAGTVTASPVVEVPRGPDDAFAPPNWIFAPTDAPTMTPAPTGSMAPTVSKAPAPAPTVSAEPTAAPVAGGPPTPPNPPTVPNPPTPDGSSRPTASPAPTATPAPSAQPTVTPAPSVTPAPAASDATNRPTSSKKGGGKKKSGLATGEIVGIVVGCIMACLICMLCGLYFQQRERKATERKDSWDISTMFTDEQNLPPEGEEPAALTAEGEGDVAALADGADAAAGGAAEEPQALQKITQAAEL